MWDEWDHWDEDLLPRFRSHVTACIVLTHKDDFGDNWDIAGRTLEADDFIGPDESGPSGSIGRPRSENRVSSSRFTPDVLPLMF